MRQCVYSRAVGVLVAHENFVRRADRGSAIGQASLITQPHARCYSLGWPDDRVAQARL